MRLTSTTQLRQDYDTTVKMLLAESEGLVDFEAVVSQLRLTVQRCMADTRQEKEEPAAVAAAGGSGSPVKVLLCFVRLFYSQEATTTLSSLTSDWEECTEFPDCYRRQFGTISCSLWAWGVSLEASLKCVDGMFVWFVPMRAGDRCAERMHATEALFKHVLPATIVHRAVPPIPARSGAAEPL